MTKAKSAYGKDLHGVKMSKIAGEVNLPKGINNTARVTEKR